MSFLSILSGLAGGKSDEDIKKLLESASSDKPIDVGNGMTSSVPMTFSKEDSAGVENPTYVPERPGDTGNPIADRRAQQEALLAKLRDPDVLASMKAKTEPSGAGQFMRQIANVLQYTPRGGRIGNAIVGNMNKGKARADNALAEQVAAGNQLEDTMRKDEEQQIRNQQEKRAQYEFEHKNQDFSSLTPQAQVYQNVLSKYNPELADQFKNMGASQLAQVTPITEKQAEDQRRMEDNLARLAEIKSSHAQNFALRQQEAENKQGRAGEAQDQKTRKDLNDMFDQMNPTGRGGLLNRDLIQRQQAAERLQALALGTNGDVRNLTKQQMVELARSLDSVITGSKGTATEGMTKALVPESAAGNLQNMVQYLTNAPRGTNQQAFIQNMLDTADREKSLATEQLKDRMAQTASKYSYLKNKGPDAESEYNRNLKTLGFDPEKDFDENGRYIRQGIGKAVQTSPKETAPPSDSNEVERIDSKGRTAIFNSKTKQFIRFK